jgi:hypothetical protein
MVCIVNFVAKKVERSKGKGIHSVYIVLARSGKSKLGTKVQENIGGLRDDEVAVLEERWGEVRRVSMAAASEPSRDSLPGFIKRQRLSVFVLDASFLEDEPDMFTAAWNACVVNEFVGGSHADLKVEVAGEAFLEC